MADGALILEVITPEQVTLRVETSSVVVPGVDGELGVLRDHAPLLAGLKPGVVTYKTEHGAEKLVVAGGFIEVAHNVVSILAPAAEKGADIDFVRAEAAKKRAQERIAKKEGVDMARAEAALARANARLSLRV